MENGFIAAKAGGCNLEIVQTSQVAFCGVVGTRSSFPHNKPGGLGCGGGGDGSGGGGGGEGKGGIATTVQWAKLTPCAVHIA